MINLKNKNSGALMNKYIDILEKKLSEYLPLKKPEIIYEAMAYSLLSGGKRVRPLLLLYTTEILEGEISKALPYACALEMIHTYSLIHDDLPALDNDDFRRNKPTSHKVYGEDIAILAGDGLLNTAFEIMFEDAVTNPQGIKAGYLISKYAGINGMIGGQVVDVISEGKEISKETLSFIHENKTSALFRASLSAGASISGCGDDVVNKFDQIGYNIGMAFQIKDDILDISSNSETLGKPVKSDLKNNKNTYVSMFGLEKAYKDSEKFGEDALRLISETCGVNNSLYELAEFLTKRVK